MKPEMATQLNALERENARLKKMVAEKALEMEIFKESVRANWYALKAVDARYPPCVAV